MCTWLRTRCRAESGAVVVWVVLMLPVVLGMLAFAVDVGVWYWQQQQEQSAADAAALAAARDLPGSPSSAATDAQSYVSRNISGATMASITPYSGDSATIKVTVSKPGPLFFASILGISSPTITATAVARNTQVTTIGSFFYAASTACNAITITHGGDDFSQAVVWSNGGVTASGAQDTASQVLVGNPTCAFPSQLAPPGETATSTFSGWPQPLPAIPAPCSATDITVDSSWLSSHPPGVYCTMGRISITAGNSVFNGYEFVSQSAASNAISVTQSGNTFTGVGSGAAQAIFYATVGGIAINNPITINGALFAPLGLVTFTGGSSPETGFIEANSITLNNGPYTFTGVGPTPTQGSRISLLG